MLNAVRLDVHVSIKCVLTSTDVKSKEKIMVSQLTFTCSKSTIKTLQKYVDYVQS